MASRAGLKRTAMPIYDLDDKTVSTLFEPLKIKVGGKELTIPDVDRKEFERITEITNGYEQLALWAHVNVTEINSISMQKVAVALKIITKELLGPAIGNFAPKKA